MATNAYKAARAQVEALAAPIPQTWEYLWAEYQDIKREADELGARCRPLRAKLNEVTDKRIGPKPKDHTRSAWDHYYTRRQPIEKEVAPELDAMERQWDDIRDFVLDLEAQLVTMPAPDTAGLLFKLNWLWAHELEEKDRTHTDGHSLVYARAILMDAHRLLSGEA
jgi:hypothetical protein